MVWRIVSGFFGISFLVAGFNVASNAQDSCARVTLVPAEGRSIGYTCWSEEEWAHRDDFALVDESGATRPPPDTSVSATLIALGAFAIGGILLLFGVLPLLRMLLLRGSAPETDDEILREMQSDRPAAGSEKPRKSKRTREEEPREMPWDRAARERAEAREAKAAQGASAEPALPEGAVPEGGPTE